jgi:hypothetical protein
VLRLSYAVDLVMFISVVLINLCLASIITCVARFLDYSRFILFMGLVLLLILLCLVYAYYYGTSGVQRFYNSWHVSVLFVIV